MLQVLATLADNAKHNQHGRIDENGAIRHRDVELCPIGALAMKFFAYFHILSKGPPGFVPDFDSTEHGEFGYREWYDHFVFWGEDVKKEMSYDSKYLHITLSHTIALTISPQITMLTSS